MVKIMFSSGSRAWANNLNDLRERWNIRREEPVKFVVPVSLFKQDIRKLPRSDLLKLKIDLIELMNKGKKELLRHKNIKREEGVYMQADQYSDLFFTIQAIGTHIQKVDHVLGETRTLSFPQIFVEVCREELSGDMFTELQNKARERVRETKEL